MEVLNIQDEKIVFLDHKALIDELYKERTEENSSGYEIKSEVFYYFPNEPKNHLSSKRKRKRECLVTENRAQEFRMNFFEELSTVLKKFLKIIAEPDPKLPSSPITLEQLSCSDDFPVFKGENNTPSFVEYLGTHQGFKKETTYIIPPYCKFYNNDINSTKMWDELAERDFDLIIIDPPWYNKYIRRLKRSRSDLSYKMLCDDQIKYLPIQNLVRKNGQQVVAIWCTNSKKHQDTLLNECLPAWNLILVHTLKWLKVDAINCLPIVKIGLDLSKKQPYEMIYFAIPKDTDSKFIDEIKEINLVVSVPSIMHSHKPPLLPMLRKYLKNKDSPSCLELFARYLQPYHTSIGLETLKLMDASLYDVRLATKS